MTIPLDAYPIKRTASTAVHLDEPGTWVIATTGGDVTATMPYRSQTPGSTSVARISPAPEVNVYRIIVPVSARPVTLNRSTTDTFRINGDTTATSITIQPGDVVTIYDDHTNWVPVWEQRSDPFRLGIVLTVDPRVSNAVATWPSANRALYVRCLSGGRISKVGIEVGTQSGNISVAAYRNSGSGTAAVPGTRLATSGAVACPAASAGTLTEVALDAAVNLSPGDWLGMSCDNTTATFARTTPNSSTLNGVGLAHRQGTAHPLPSTPAVDTGPVGTGYIPLLLGIV